MITYDEHEYLLKSMKALLSEYGYKYDNNALNKIIREWGTKKATLIEAFKRHPNYVPGQFMIAFEGSYNRDIDVNASKVFSDWLTDNCIHPMRNQIPEAIRIGYPWNGNLPSNLYEFLHYELHEYAAHTITEDTANRVNRMIPEIRAREGQRMSKIINKICAYLGYDKVDGYNREYAKYADSLSPISITRHTVLSLNPLDYLTMSFGNSWASCHTIDKKNLRDMPNSYSGAYSSGTMSYMLDPSSMVLYTVDKSYEGSEYWSQDKINRQMFHWGEDKLVQGRLYPQANDYNGEAYKPYRNVVQEIISTIFGFSNLWRVKKGTDNASAYINTCGTHYPDYYHYSGCNVSIVSSSENTNKFTVGARPICIECGARHGNESNISCCAFEHICPECDDPIDFDYDDYVEINGRYYHTSCCCYCDHGEHYTPYSTTYVEEIDGYVCDECLGEHYTYCECCHEYHRNGSVAYVGSTGRNVCDDCLERYYERCDVCGEYHRNIYHRTNADGDMVQVCRRCAISMRGE